jgi:hypothetical protein
MKGLPTQSARMPDLRSVYPPSCQSRRRIAPPPRKLCFASRASTISRPSRDKTTRRANHSKPVQPHWEKYFTSPVGQIISTHSRHPVPLRGAYRDRHGRGMGCGGRGSVLRATGLQGGLYACERLPSERTRDDCSVRRSRVVLTPQWLASSLRRRVGSTGLRRAISADDGVKQARSPGRARSKS